MAKRRISVERVSNNPQETLVQVVVWEKRKVEGEMQEVPLGQQPLSFPANTEPEDMMPRIRAAARDIEALADKAKTTRAKLNKLLEKGGEE